MKSLSLRTIKSLKSFFKKLESPTFERRRSISMNDIQLDSPTFERRYSISLSYEIESPRGRYSISSERSDIESPTFERRR